MHSLVVVDTLVSDDADYEFYTENLLQNTLTPYWDWSNKTDTEIEFTRTYTEEGYRLRMLVTATFKTKVDMSIFKLAFSKLPKTTYSEREQIYA
jgi:hypothetical protein